MRSSTSGERTVLAATFRKTYFRVKIADPLGAMQDYGDFSSYSWLCSVMIDENIDQPIAGATITLRREIDLVGGLGYTSLSPFRTDSPANPLGPSVYVFRPVTIDIAVVTGGRPVDASTDWKRRFDGVSDRISMPDDDTIVISCRDQGAYLMDNWVYEQRQLVVYNQSIANVLETLFTYVRDGIPVAGSAGTVQYVPGVPEFVVTSFPSKFEPVMTAIQRLMELVAADFRWGWNDTAGAYQWTVTTPERTSPSSAATIGSSSVVNWKRFDLDRLAIRNSIVVSFLKKGSTARSTVTSADATSMTTYGRRVLTIQEPDDSSIDTTTEATNLADLVKADLKDPKAEGEMEMLPDWRIEINDYLTFSANKYFNVAQGLAVVGLRLELEPDDQRMFLTVRGIPSAGYRRWIERAKNLAGRDLTDADNGLTQLTYADAADGSTRTWSWVRGDNVAMVILFEGTQANPIEGLVVPFPPVDDIVAAAVLGTDGYSILPIDTDTYVADRPAFGYTRTAILTPFYKSGSRLLQGKTVKLEFVPDVDTIPQGTVSINEDGSVTLSVDGNIWVGSFKYSTSTGGFPSDATVLASGTILNGRQASVAMAANTLDLGDTIYATFIPYEIADAGGVPGASFRVRGTRHDASSTVTTFSTMAAMTEAGPGTFGEAQWQVASGNYLSNRNWPGTYPATFWGARVAQIFTIPSGVTVTGISCDMYVDATAQGSVTAKLQRIGNTGTATDIATVTTNTTGWQTKTASCSESTTSQNYRVHVSLDGADPAFGNHRPIDNDLRASVWSYTYSRPSTRNAI